VSACRLHLTGASGSGTTTLGRALASHWSVPHADADDYFWVPTSPPYTVKRPVPQRLRLMNEIFVGRDAWVLSGSVMGWGGPVVELVDAVVFLSVDHGTRLHRLHDRETQRYGPSIGPGGAREADHREFIEWASGYEDPTFEGRNRAQHEEWLTGLPCPVLRLDSSAAVADLVAETAAWQEGGFPPGARSG
jgi:adenylate kinase family enzyme